MTIQELTQKLASDSGNWELRRELVELLVSEGRHDTAVEVVNAGEALPHEPGPWLAAAQAYAAVGAIEQAASLVATALEIDPDHEASQRYRDALDELVPQAAVALTADDVEEDAAPRARSAREAAPLLKKSADGEATPMMLPKVAFSNHEIEALRAAEEAARMRREAVIRRDKFNSLTITVLVHVAIVLALTLMVTQTPPRVPPQIVASSPSQQQEEMIENMKMEKPTVEPTTAVNSAIADIISVNATSSFTVSSLDVPVADVAVEQTMSFTPSVSLGMPTSPTSKMMFGQPMEGEVLGVILDVSGSMAEFLPAVVREVDKNFKDSPIVYIRNILFSNDNREGEVRLIVPEEVVPIDPEYKTRTPYWFLWHDLPRKAPQRYVDRLIETFKTRPNQYLTVARWEGSSPSTAINWLMEQKIDSLYIFSDFEDFVDDKIAAEIGQKLGRRKIRTYLQPAEGGTDFLKILTNKVANKTLGRQMPSLVSLLRGNEDEKEVTSLIRKNREADIAALAEMNVQLATPRETLTGDGFFAFKPSANWSEIHRLSEPEYDAVFYGPEARAEIFLKDASGKYIQNPITFFYHSWKEIPDHPDPRYRRRTRKFLRVEEPPSFDGKEIVWKMVLEDELKFRVHLYLGRKGMNATYVAEPPKDGTYDSPHIYFRIPALATERQDRYFGFDFPSDGLKLDQVREAVKTNEVVFNLPRQDRDRYLKQWQISGFDMGYNTRNFAELIRQYPTGIRDVVVQGPSFGPRKFHARTTSSKILLNGGAGRADMEPWESFWFSLYRGRNERTKFTKTEAIEIQIE
jgi:hypothetical protein